MHSRHAIVLALAALVGATACGGGATGVFNPCAPASGSVAGCVTDSRGGSAVVGAMITASPAGTTTTTDSRGIYALSLSPGTYDITASKSGKAASKFRGVIVQSGQTTTANLILPDVFDPSNPNVSAPTITVSGLNQGQDVTGTLSFTVSVAASNPVRRIDLRTSNMNALPQASIADTGSATFTLNSTLLANGAAFVDIIAYDLNQNVAELVVGFQASNAVSSGRPQTPGIFPIAITTGQSLGLFSAQRAQRFSALRLTQDPNLVKVGSRSINLLAAPSNATLYVEVQWSAVTGAVGYKVYRSFTSSGPYAQIGEVNGLFYDDTDPSLAPGVIIFYRVSAFNTGGEGAPSPPVPVTPLPPFNLSVTSPADNAADVPTVPTFTWTLTAMVGTHQFYDISVQGLNDPSPAWITTNFSIVDTTSVVYGTSGTPSVNPLTNGKAYQWDIYQAAAQTLYADAYGPYSEALSFANGVPSGSLNGPFKFTTVP